MVFRLQRRAVMLALLALALATTLACATAPTCRRRTMDAKFVGGGFTSDSRFVTVHHYSDDTGKVESHIQTRDVSTGNVIPSESFTVPLGSVQAITCPQKGIIGIALIALAFSDGINLVQPYIYNSDRTEIGMVFRTTKDIDYQIYFSPDCNRLLIQAGGQKAQTWDVNNLKKGQVNDFDIRKEDTWLQMASATIGVTSKGNIIKRLGLYGMAGQYRNKKNLGQIKVQGTVRNFAVSPDGKFIFVTGLFRGVQAFKNIVRVAKPRALMVDLNAADLNGLHTAFAPSGTMYAGTFSRASGNNVVKVYSTSGLNGVLKYTFLEESSSNLLYFSPDSSKLLVFGSAAAQEFWICDPL